MSNETISEKRIWVFGNPDKTELGFEIPGNLQEYLRSDIFQIENGRYRYTLSRHAEVIVMSRDGLAYGHLDVIEKVKPTEADRKAYPKVRFVYVIGRSSLYEKPVLLSQLSIKVGRFGTKITGSQFQELQKLAGKVTEHSERIDIPQSTYELERVLREVRQRLGQSEFRLSLIRAYSGKCAITGYDGIDALEAAHIVPYADVSSSETSNGLLLRADVHTLFDRHLLGVNPKALVVV